MQHSLSPSVFHKYQENTLPGVTEVNKSEVPKLKSKTEKTMKKRKIILLIIGVVLLLLSVTVARTFFYNIMTSRVSFPDDKIASDMTMSDGNSFKILRHLQVKGDGDNESDYTVFIVRFKFSSLSLEANKRLSMIPAPFLMGMEGFRDKYWTFNEETKTFQGIYQWSTAESAENYPESFIYNVMVKRSAPDTLEYKILPGTKLSNLITANMGNH